jgi:hypothetical protein
MDYFLAKELKDAGFPQNGKSCDTHSDINHSTLVERFVHPTLSELIEACPKRFATPTAPRPASACDSPWGTRTPMSD